MTGEEIVHLIRKLKEKGLSSDEIIEYIEVIYRQARCSGRPVFCIAAGELWLRDESADGRQQPLYLSERRVQAGYDSKARTDKESICVNVQ